MHTVILKPFADDSPIRIIVPDKAFIGKNGVRTIEMGFEKDTAFEKSFVSLHNVRENLFCLIKNSRLPKRKNFLDGVFFLAPY